MLIVHNWSFGLVLPQNIFVGIYWNDCGMVMVGRYIDSVLVVVWEVVEESEILILSVVPVMRRKM